MIGIVLFGLGLVGVAGGTMKLARVNKRFKVAHEGPGGARKAMGIVTAASAATSESRDIEVAYDALGKSRLADIELRRGAGSPQWWARIIQQTNAGSRIALSYSLRAPDDARAVLTEYGSPPEAWRGIWERAGIGLIVTWSSLALLIAGAILLPLS